MSYPESDKLASNLADSFRVQLLVNRCVEEIQREFHKSKDEHGECISRGSPFVQEIQDKLIPFNFHLPTLEAYDNNYDMAEHVATFQVQMALYDISNTLMCRAFPTTLRGPALIPLPSTSRLVHYRAHIGQSITEHTLTSTLSGTPRLVHCRVHLGQSLTDRISANRLSSTSQSVHYRAHLNESFAEHISVSPLPSTSRLVLC
ncbi:hypothetical protein B296_00015567 [Ensete ventricosum]|uniref:Uncharacterized protein n=1 Tax=Ensete ventricosum TaxID=4639 RepID=A0A426YS89_ENSVE|nr:hypothetical protein B296_00015567 [Ensete ventricosum]